MQDVSAYYAPDWPLVIFALGATALVCLTVLFFAYPHGVRGAAITVAAILGLWFGALVLLRVLAIWSMVAYGIFLVYGLVFTLPILIGSALGFLFAWGLMGRWPDQMD